MATVKDNPLLLKTLLEDSTQETSLWRPASYWYPYSQRIHNELNKVGLENFRTNQRILKGFGHGGIMQPAKPRATWKRFIWDTVENLPLVKLIVDKYKHINRVYHRRVIQQDKKIASLALDEIAQRFPDIKIPAGTCNGGGEDGFEWRGHMVSADWVKYLSRVADFYTAVPSQNVKAIVEIGPGIGLTSLAHIALNPHLKTIVNIDIVPIIYISGQFLDSDENIKVVNYLDTKDLKEIRFDNDEKLTIYALPPWELHKITSEVDYFFNAYSFMEMEQDICQNYADIIEKITRQGILIHSILPGHAPDAGGQKAPVTMDFLVDLFEKQYPHAEKISGVWPAYYDGDIEEVRLMRKKAA